MSPDRTTLTRADAIRLRKEDDQQQREKRAPKSPSIRAPRSESAAIGTPKANRSTPRSISSPQKHGSGASVSINRNSPGVAARITSGKSRHRYDIAMSTPRARSGTFSAPKAPRIALSLPRLQFGPRWFSFLIVIFCVVDMYLMLNIDPFIVRRATIQGAERLNTQDIENVLGANNLAAALLNPAQIEYNLLVSFPEISAAQVQINLPAELVITIKERGPVAAWTQDDQTVWIDAEGFAFAPRGEAPNLISINANGAPPAPAGADLAQTVGAHRFMTAELVSAISTLAPSLPEGATLVFDPEYGLGWNDPNGWKVYFGNSYTDTPIKLQVVQSILKYLAEQDLHPTLISVAYPSAPFYRLKPLEQ